MEFSSGFSSHVKIITELQHERSLLLRQAKKKKLVNYTTQLLDLVIVYR
jgi:hypothetical protein